jgi:hypothetical protein
MGIPIDDIATMADAKDAMEELHRAVQKAWRYHDSPSLRTTYQCTAREHWHQVRGLMPALQTIIADLAPQEED